MTDTHPQAPFGGAVRSGLVRHPPPGAELTVPEATERPLPRPPLVGAVNTLGRALLGLGMPVVRFDEASLIAEAAARTGLADFDAARIREPLRLLLRAYEREAKLNFVGRIAARQHVAQLLLNRLRLRAARSREPAIARQEIRRPVFITGLPRSGTTFLHRLLAEDPANRVPRVWEVMYPSPLRDGTDADRRIRVARAERNIAWLHYLAPRFKAIHPLGAGLPQECISITAHAFLSYEFNTVHRVPTYQAWLGAQDLRPAYAFHRRFLQHLQWGAPPRRWVLKAPAHMFDLDALFAIYPDAVVIQTHRNPLEVVGSAASLTAILYATFSDQVDLPEIGAEVLDHWAEGTARAIASRARPCAPPERFIDVHYRELVRDPLATVRRIYARLGLGLDAGAERRMEHFLGRNPRHKHGVHSYSLARVGLDRAAVARRFAHYCDHFQVAPL